MIECIIAYHGEMKRPESPEEGKSQMDAWHAWLDKLGDAVVNPGSPLGKSRIVDADGVSEDDWSNQMFGFTIVRADSLDAAIEMAQGCPVIEQGGRLRVAELRDMGM